MIALVATLSAALQALAAGSGLTVAVAVAPLDGDGAAVGVRAEQPMPMASTFKLPLAIVVLRAIERGALPPLDGKVTLLPSDMMRGASPLYERMPHGGPVTMREVLASLLEHSDNSAADGLLRLAGGAARVTAELRALGVGGIAIDRGEAELRRATAGATPEAHRAALARFAADPRDRATPSAMVALLRKLWRNRLLAPASTKFIEDEMARCVTGVRRLRGGLPPATQVADRTGTCDGLGREDADCANAVGVITLPSGARVAVAVFVAGAGPLAAKEKLIADVARVVWAEHTTQPDATRR